jgi:hypothetical protein
MKIEIVKSRMVKLVEREREKTDVTDANMTVG